MEVIEVIEMRLIEEMSVRAKMEDDIHNVINRSKIIEDNKVLQEKMIDLVKIEILQQMNDQIEQIEEDIKDLNQMIILVIGNGVEDILKRKRKKKGIHHLTILFPEAKDTGDMMTAMTFHKEVTLILIKETRIQQAYQ